MAEALVGGVGLALRGVAHLHDDGGDGAADAGGTVEIAGDVEAGAGFEDHFIDAVGGAFDGAGDAGVEGSTFGLAADEGPEFLAGPAAAFGYEFGGGEFGEIVIAAFVRGKREFPQIGGKAVRVLTVCDAGVGRRLLPGWEVTSGGDGGASEA